ncbi:MOSC domain-containing protein [Pseudomonas sp. 148P]|uniref:MOSC domain-containing protein n=1 Tax=Pseudomonas ulcerans TaxID=3115852 RepID=A0ABU7HQI1_9PSED|nr:MULTISPECIES: MOSC domain-containing protein [unclassified Pseudomonas]MEE1923730.1 MOSC domain-containing protein [Pseudomonas sp. 147P]MEE1933790.1 MOSC domain-containing protein [Pseudomonas sp. 148P]
MRLSALYRYPLKSAQGEALQRSPSGLLGLDGDRRWMLVDAGNNRFLTQRAFPQMSQLSALYAADGGLSLNAPGLPTLHVPVPDPDDALRGVTIWRDTLRVPDAGDAAAQWLSSFMGREVRLVHVPQARTRYLPSGYGENSDRVAFADGFPLLLIGQASLDDLAQKVGRPMEMMRFRPNLVIEGAEAFAEDGWKRIRIGQQTFRVVKPCGRCILTTIDPATGERSPDREPFATLMNYRQKEGEAMFGQNLVADGESVLEVGMGVEVLE